MLRKAASRARGTLSTHLQQNGSLLENGFQYRSFSTLRQGTRPAFSPKPSHGLPDPPPRRSFTQLYLYMLAKHPIATKSITASAIFAVGDVVRQGIVRYQMSGHLDMIPWNAAKNPEELPWNVNLTLLSAAVGLFIAGPSTHFWFNFVSKVVPARTLTSTLKKMAMEQLILGPITTVVAATLVIFVGGKTMSDFAADVEPFLPALLKNELLLWPATAFFTYRHVPVHLQPLARSLAIVASSIWFTYNTCTPSKINAFLGSPTIA